MGANIKNLRTRIKSVNSTLHLTKAMGLVASSKIRRSQMRMTGSLEYAEAVGEVIASLTSCRDSERSPYMRKSEGKTLLVVIAGDRGLAGGYNANVFRLAKQFGDADFIPVGKYACDRFGKGYISSEDFSPDNARELADRICNEFCDNKYSKVGIIYTKYISMMTQEATVKWVLPLEKSDKKSSGILFEPDENTVLGEVVSEYLTGALVATVRESFASEVAARRVAMDAAGKNAQEMLDGLALSYNRARQGAITQEITEIVAGSGL